MLLLLALAHNDQALLPGVVKILANYIKSEVAISSRLSQIQQPTFFVICTQFIRLMVPTGLIGALKPNTKAFKQNNLKSAQLLSSEGAQRGEKTKDDECQEYRLVCRQ